MILYAYLFSGAVSPPSHCISISGLQVPWHHQNIMFWFGLAPSLLLLSTSQMVISYLFFLFFFFGYHRKNDCLLHNVNTRYSLTLYVPRIVTHCINKPTECTFCMYLFHNFCTTLHVSNDISFETCRVVQKL